MGALPSPAARRLCRAPVLSAPPCRPLPRAGTRRLLLFWPALASGPAGCAVGVPPRPGPPAGRGGAGSGQSRRRRAGGGEWQEVAAVEKAAGSGRRERQERAGSPRPGPAPVSGPARLPAREVPGRAAEGASLRRAHPPAVSGAGQPQPRACLGGAVGPAVPLLRAGPGERRWRGRAVFWEGGGRKEEQFFAQRK